jgi:hypothetical protein
LDITLQPHYNQHYYNQHCQELGSDLSRRMTGRGLAAIDRALTAILQQNEMLTNKSFIIVRSDMQSVNLLISSTPGLSERQLMEMRNDTYSDMRLSGPDDEHYVCDFLGRESLFRRRG